MHIIVFYKMLDQSTAEYREYKNISQEKVDELKNHYKTFDNVKYVRWINYPD